MSLFLLFERVLIQNDKLILLDLYLFQTGSRPNRGVDDLPGLLEKYSKRSSGTRGINKRSLRGTKTIGAFDVNVIGEYFQQPLHS